MGRWSGSAWAWLWCWSLCMWACHWPIYCLQWFSLTEAFNIESLSYVRSMAALSPEKHFELKTPKKSQAFKRFVLTTLMFTEQQDIQIRGANRDEKKIMMALRYPNSTHYLTYRHSLRVCCCFVVPCHLLLLLLLLSFSLMILCVSAVEGHLLLFVVSSSNHCW